MSFTFQRVEIKGDMVLFDIIYDDGTEQACSKSLRDNLNVKSDLPYYLHYVEELSKDETGNWLDWFDDKPTTKTYKIRDKYHAMQDNNIPLTHPAIVTAEV